MEEEKNPNKKEKKHKKGQKLLAEADSVEEEVKKEKKKKMKKVDYSLEAGGRKEKIKKIKEESVCDAVDANNEASKKKKKRKKEVLVEEENLAETLKCTVNKEKQANNKKTSVKNKSAQTKREKIKVEKEMCDNAAETDVQVKAKVKKKKKKKTSPTTNGANCTNIKESFEVVDNDPKLDSTDAEQKKGKVKKKKKGISLSAAEINTTKKKFKRPDNCVKLETASTEIKDVKRKKAQPKAEEVQIKTKKKKIKEASDGEECEGKLPKTKSEFTNPGEVKTKNKKQKLSETTVERKEPKKKKEKRVKEEKQFLNDCEGVEEEVQPSRKKKKKCCDEEESGNKAAQRKKKKKIEDAQEASQGDVVLLSVKNGNTDEVNINQERRQALQIDVDKASQPPKPAKPTGLGQWSSVQFDSSDKQQKFLRLMGGYKKSFQPVTSSGTAANMALGRDQQQQLQQGLLGEFDRAHSRRMDFSGRSAGLGYSALPDKKFSIDVNAHRSVRFDEQ